MIVIGTALAAAAGYLLFPTVADAHGAGSVFLFFAVMGVIVFAVVRAVLPEPRERSLEELETIFQGGRS